MELSKIEILIEKYFDGQSSLEEEKQLQEYFTTKEVPAHLKQYQPVFGYFAQAKHEKALRPQMLPERRHHKTWFSIAASVVILVGVGTFTYLNQQPETSADLGTYDNPEAAFRETQRALNLLSTHVNTGVESVQYIEEYDVAKNRIFARY